MRKEICLLVFALLATSGWASTAIIRPNGQGAYSSWTNSGCTYGWQCVDEVNPANATDYVYTARTVYETFQFEDVSIPSNWTINSITLYYYGEDYYYGEKYYSGFRPVVRIGTANHLGSVKVFPDNWGYVSYTMTTNPATGMAWTSSAINSLQAGLFGASLKFGAEPILFFGGGKLAQMYVLVDYN